MAAKAEDIQHDTELVARLKSQEPEALGVLYDRYGATAYTLLLRIVGDRSQAEALLAQTFLAIWNRVHALKQDPVCLRLWTFWLARRFAIAELSPRGKDGADFPDAFRCVEMYEVLQAPETNSLDGQPNDREAFLRLAQWQREALELAFFEGCSHQEIASRLGKTTTEASQVLNSALKTVHGNGQN